METNTITQESGAALAKQEKNKVTDQPLFFKETSFSSLPPQSPPSLPTEKWFVFCASYCPKVYLGTSPESMRREGSK